MIVKMPITGILSVDTDSQSAQGTFQTEGTPIPQPPDPPQPPAHGNDMIDMSSIIITRDSPDVRNWPITTPFQSLTLSDSANAAIEFGKRFGDGAWPFVPGPEGGDLQYTLWVVVNIDGQWYACGAILCISRGQDDNYVPTGPTLEAGQLPNNWYYYVGDPMQEYQPKPGEQVGWFLTSGVQRRNDIHAVAERTNIVLAPFSPGLHTF